MDVTGYGAANSYHVVAELGQGAFGIVFRAHGTDGVAYALKVIDPEAVKRQDPGVNVRWVYDHEVAKLNSVGRLQPQCPNLLQLREAFIDHKTGLHCIVTELVEVGGLDEIM
jgi:serine/threonine protein kinase